MSNVTWETFNRETYARVGATPLSAEYTPSYTKRYRIALVSMFSVESLGARALYAFMKEAGFDIDLIFLKEHALNNFKMPTEKEQEIFIDLLRERKIDFVGFSARSPYMKILAELTKQVQDKLKIPVVWGGTVGTVTPKLCVEQGADFAVCNEGEDAFAELVNALATGSDYTGIKNLWFKGENGEVVGNDIRPLIDDLDRLPIQDLEDDNKFYVERDKLTPGEPWRKLTKFETLTARGCPYKCSFCIHSYLVDMNKGLGKNVNSGTVEHVIRELEYAMAKLPNMKSIFFADEVFGTGIGWVRDFVEPYRERIGLPFECAIEPRALTEEKVDLLARAGMMELNIGIQAGSEEVRRDLFDRPMTNKRLFEVIDWIGKHNIDGRYDIIADNPFETTEQKRTTLEVLLQIKRPFILNLYSLNYFPGSKLTDYAIKMGVIDESEVAGLSEKALRQFIVSFDYPRSNEDKLFNALYRLSSKRFLPKKLLLWLADFPLAKRYPQPTITLAVVSSLVKLFFDGWILLYQGRIGWDTVRRYSGSIMSIAR